MRPENFVYWLQGYVELSGEHPPTEQQWQQIKDHLKLVFDKKTPDYSNLKINLTESSDFNLTDPLKSPFWQKDYTDDKFKITC